MRKTLSNVLFFVGLSIVVSCGADTLKPFSSDGCSLFPDSDLITKDQWCKCCFEHDVAYWQGGTKAQRKVADLSLKNCVYEKTQNPLLANVMYEGVRFGGSPYFYNWYRWGYGWPYKRKYQVLTTEELRQVEAHLNEFLWDVERSVCGQ